MGIGRQNCKVRQVDKGNPHSNITLLHHPSLIFGCMVLSIKPHTLIRRGMQSHSHTLAGNVHYFLTFLNDLAAVMAMMIITFGPEDCFTSSFEKVRKHVSYINPHAG